jgi:predicted RNA-binding Zn ribbon-like protein
MSEASASVETFEFLAGQLCLDFANTLTERSAATPVELLRTYADVLIWSQRANVLKWEEVGQLQDVAEHQSSNAVDELALIKRTRELIYRIFSALAREGSVQIEDVQQFNQLLGETMAYSCLIPDENGFTWNWTGNCKRLEQPRWSIVRDAADLLTSPELSLVRICASEDCNWLFLDTSKNHSRRWCNMQSCGNRAKVRRHYGRKKAMYDSTET